MTFLYDFTMLPGRDVTMRGMTMRNAAPYRILWPVRVAPIPERPRSAPLLRPTGPTYGKGAARGDALE